MGHLNPAEARSSLRRSRCCHLLYPEGKADLMEIAGAIYLLVLIQTGTGVSQGDRLIPGVLRTQKELPSGTAGISASDHPPHSRSETGNGLQKFTSDQANFRTTLKQLAASVSRSAETVAL